MTTTTLVPIGSPPAPKPDRPLFATIPTRLLASMLSPSDKLIFLALSASANEAGICWQPLHEIARLAGVARASAARGTDALVDAGWVRRLGIHETYRAMTYQLVFDANASATAAELDRAATAYAGEGQSQFATARPDDDPNPQNASLKLGLRQSHGETPAVSGSDSTSLNLRPPQSQIETLATRPSLDLSSTPPSSSTSPAARGIEADAGTAEPQCELPPWDAHAPADVRDTYAEMAGAAGSARAFKRVLVAVRRTGLPWSAIGEALIELAPRGGYPSSDDVRVYAGRVVRRRATPPGSRIREDLRAMARPIRATGPSVAELDAAIDAFPAVGS